MAKPSTTAGYLASLPREQREALEKLRKQILAAAPGAVEHFGYGLPGFKLNGHPLVYFGAAKNHCAIYGANNDPESGRKAEGLQAEQGHDPVHAGQADSARAREGDREGTRGREREEVGRTAGAGRPR